MRDIAQRGVVMVGTAHGTDIHSLLNNHELSDLIGGVTSVTVGDKAASTLRRVAPGCFNDNICPQLSDMDS